MILPVYRFAIIPQFNLGIAQGNRPQTVECRDLQFLLRPDGYASARYICTDCEMATGRGFETYAFPTRDTAADFLHNKRKLEVPEHIVDQMRKHADDHVRIGAAEIAGKTVLSKEERQDLAYLLALIPKRELPLLPARPLALMRKLGAFDAPHQDPA